MFPRTTFPNGPIGDPSDEFFNFYNTLQQSALMYSQLAFRQMGYPHQNQTPGLGLSHHYTRTPPTVFRPFQNYGNVPGQGSRMAEPIVAGTSPLAPPPEIFVDNYFENSSKGGYDGVRRSARKVYFAHPLSTVKIKSPTPLYGSGEIPPFPGWIQETSNADDQDWPSNSDENIDYDYGGGVVTGFRGRGGATYLNGEGHTQGKKKRKKRRNKRRASVEQDESDFASSYLSNLSSVSQSLEDPYAIYEVPLDEEDYEFVSEIRLCGADNGSDNESCDGDQEAGVKNTSAFCNPCINLSEEGFRDMQELYGEVGAARILKMEEAVEDNFLSFRI